MKTRIILITMMISILFSVSILSAANLTISEDSWNIEIYDPTLATISTMSSLTAMAMPAVLLFEEQDSFWDLPISYGVAMGSSILSKNLIKGLTEKQRPQAFIDEFGVEDDESFESFPSGHTTLGFAATSFLTTAYLKRHPDSDMAIPAAGTALGLSTLTGFLRYSSGAHHPIDIFAGAVLGIVTGSLAAYLLY